MKKLAIPLLTAVFFVGCSTAPKNTSNIESSENPIEGLVTEIQDQYRTSYIGDITKEGYYFEGTLQFNHGAFTGSFVKYDPLEGHYSSKDGSVDFQGEYKNNLFYNGKLTVKNGNTFTFEIVKSEFENGTVTLEDVSYKIESEHLPFLSSEEGDFEFKDISNILISNLKNNSQKGYLTLDEKGQLSGKQKFPNLNDTHYAFYKNNHLLYDYILQADKSLTIRGAGCNIPLFEDYQNQLRDIDCKTQSLNLINNHFLIANILFDDVYDKGEYTIRQFSEDTKITYRLPAGSIDYFNQTYHTNYPVVTETFVDDRFEVSRLDYYSENDHKSYSFVLKNGVIVPVYYHKDGSPYSNSEWVKQSNSSDVKTFQSNMAAKKSIIASNYNTAFTEERQYIDKDNKSIAARNVTISEDITEQLRLVESYKKAINEAKLNNYMLKMNKLKSGLVNLEIQIQQNKDKLDFHTTLIEQNLATLKNMENEKQKSIQSEYDELDEQYSSFTAKFHEKERYTCEENTTHHRTYIPETFSCVLNPIQEKLSLCKIYFDEEICLTSEQSWIKMFSK